ncbi:MAG: hypothetical protein KF872_05680 [Chitinophagales bacterium]|nr:hypothetical protein [Chitinophagales bacterium]
MKKLLFGFGAVALLSVGMSSCAKKDYTCQCTTTGQVARVIIPNATKEQAETICKANETYQQGQTAVYTCKLD